MWEKVGWVEYKVCGKGGLGRVEGVWKRWVWSSRRCVKKVNLRSKFRRDKTN